MSVAIDTTTKQYISRLVEFEELCTNTDVLLADILENNQYLPRDYELPQGLRTAVADGSLLTRFRQLRSFSTIVDSGTAARLLRYFPSEAYVAQSNPVVAAALVHANGSSFDEFAILDVGDVRKTTPDFVDRSGVAVDVKVTTTDRNQGLFSNNIGMLSNAPSFTISLHHVNTLYRPNARMASAVPGLSPVVFLAVCDNSTQAVYFLNVDKLVELVDDGNLVTLSNNGNHLTVNFAKIVELPDVCMSPRLFAKFLADRHAAAGDDRLEQLLAYADDGYVTVVDRNFVFALPQVTDSTMFRGFIGANYSVSAKSLYVNTRTFDQLYRLGTLLVDVNATREDVRADVAAWFANRGVTVDNLEQDYVVRLYVDEFTSTYSKPYHQPPSFINMDELIGFDDVNFAAVNCFKRFDLATGELREMPTTIANGRGNAYGTMRLISMNVVHRLPACIQRRLNWTR